VGGKGPNKQLNLDEPPADEGRKWEARREDVTTPVGEEAVD